MRLTVGSLFSGIGGFDLGLERAGFEIKWQVEIDPYCQRVLAKHWPSVQRYGDICAIDWTTVQRVDLLCGGFPCQDLSFAGKRAGIDGARSGLWSEYVRAIRTLRPRYVLVENVPGLLTHAYMGRVLGDLAASWYDAEWDCIPASAVGAPHRRDRVWILAYPMCRRTNGSRQNPTCCRNWQSEDGKGRILWTTQETNAKGNSFDEGKNEAVADSHGRRFIKCEPKGQSAWKFSFSSEAYRRNWSAEPAVGRVAHGVPAELDVDRLTGWILNHGNSSQVEMAKEIVSNGKGRKVRILRLYLEVAKASQRLEKTERCNGSLSDMPYDSGSEVREMGKRKKGKTSVQGLPMLVSTQGLTRSQDVRQQDMPLDIGEVERWLTVGDRVNRLKGLGNAIVPQIAEALGRMILETEAPR